MRKLSLSYGGRIPDLNPRRPRGGAEKKDKVKLDIEKNWYCLYGYMDVNNVHSFYNKVRRSNIVFIS